MPPPLISGLSLYAICGAMSTTAAALMLVRAFTDTLCTHTHTQKDLLGAKGGVIHSCNFKDTQHVYCIYIGRIKCNNPSDVEGRGKSGMMRKVKSLSGFCLYLTTQNVIYRRVVLWSYTAIHNLYAIYTEGGEDSPNNELIPIPLMARDWLAW